MSITYLSIMLVSIRIRALYIFGILRVTIQYRKRSSDMTKLTLPQLESHLWQSANILRGSIDSSDYKNYIFGLLFLKRLSDVFVEHAKEVEEKEDDDYAWYDRDEHQFFVPERARWENIQIQTHDIGNTINKAFEALEEENSSLVGVLANIDFNDK